MRTGEYKVRELLEIFAVPYGYAVVTFEYFEQDSYYRARLMHFDKTHPITLIIFQDQVLESIRTNQLSPSITKVFAAELASASRGINSATHES